MSRVKRIRLEIIIFGVGFIGLNLLLNHLEMIKHLNDGGTVKAWNDYFHSRPATPFEWFTGIAFGLALLYLFWWMISEILPNTRVADWWDYLHDRITKQPNELA